MKTIFCIFSSECAPRGGVKLKGIYETEQEAIDSIEVDHWFLAECELNARIPDESDDAIKLLTTDEKFVSVIALFILSGLKRIDNA